MKSSTTPHIEHDVPLSHSQFPFFFYVLLGSQEIYFPSFTNKRSCRQKRRKSPSTLYSSHKWIKRWVNFPYFIRQMAICPTYPYCLLTCLEKWVSNGSWTDLFSLCVQEKFSLWQWVACEGRKCSFCQWHMISGKWRNMICSELVNSHCQWNLALWSISFLCQFQYGRRKCCEINKWILTWHHVFLCPVLIRFRTHVRII